MKFPLSRSTVSPDVPAPRFRVAPLDVPTLRWLLVLIHLGFSTACFQNPTLFEKSAGFSAFLQTGGTVYWGSMTLAAGLMLLVSLRLTWLLIISQLVSALVLVLICVTVSHGAAGISTGSYTYGVLAAASFYAYVATLTNLLRRQRGL